MTILRCLLKQRGYVLLAVLTLAVAVGANVVVFTIVNALWPRAQDWSTSPHLPAPPQTSRTLN